MPESITEEQFKERFPEIAEAYENFSREKNFSPEAYGFNSAYVLDDGTLNVVAWYPVGFDFSSAVGDFDYSWINYEAGEGFHFIEE